MIYTPNIIIGASLPRTASINKHMQLLLKTGHEKRGNEIFSVLNLIVTGGGKYGVAKAVK